MRAPDSSPVNPYESPPAAEPAAPTAYAWRQGNTLIMHFKAQLPPICVRSGRPADGKRKFLLIWRPQGNVLTREAWLAVPLCGEVLNYYERQRRLTIAGLVLAASSVVLIFLTGGLVHWLQYLWVCLLIPLMMTGGVGVLMWLVCRAGCEIPLSLQSARGDYLCFEGLHPGFLAALPEMPPNP